MRATVCGSVPVATGRSPAGFFALGHAAPACAHYGKVHAAIRRESAFFILIYGYAAKLIKLIRHGRKKLRRAARHSDAHITIPACTLPQFQVKEDGHFRRGK